MRQAVNSMVTEDKLGVFLELLDHISDETIMNYIKEVGKFKLPAHIDTPNTEIYYYYGGNKSEFLFKKVAKYIKKNYVHANIICLEKKGHCENALLNPDEHIKELNKILLRE